MPVSKKLLRHLPSFILGLTLLVIYLYTLAPGLTWANNGSDGGDLITAAYTGGIAHPTGYPLYLLLARLFQLVPIGSLAFRTNLMSAVFAVLSAVLVYRLVVRSLTDQGIVRAWLAGLASGFAFGLAPLVWSQAVITEVYALQAFLTVLVLYLFVFPFQGMEQKSQERLQGLGLGLAMGNHVTTVFLTPLILFSGFGKRVGSQAMTFASSLTRQLVWFAIGLSLYLTLPLRALAGPPVNWGNPITFRRFWWLVSGELYQSYYLRFEFAETGGRLQVWASLLLQQFGWLGLVLGVLGLILLFKPSRLYLSTVWMGLVYGIFSLLYSSSDSYLYLIPVIISFAIWIGLALGSILERIPSNLWVLSWGMGVLIAAHFGFHTFSVAPQIDASKDQQAEMFGRQVMADVPENALVFTRGDQAIFSLWYFHFALGQRPDLALIAEELLHFDWYLDTLQDAYPGLSIPGPFPWAQNVVDANQGRPACYVQITYQADIECGTREQP